MDVRGWHRQGRLRADQYFLCSWQCRGEPSGEMIVLTECDHVILIYKSRGWGTTKAEPILQRVAVAWTDCHFGGRRPWFICDCGRRAAVLYAAGEFFGCRRCRGLVYSTQQESPYYRNLTAAQKIRERLGGSPAIFDGFPEKPKRMHERTYRRLRARAERAEAVCTALTERWLSRPTKHLKAGVRRPRYAYLQKLIAWGIKIVPPDPPLPLIRVRPQRLKRLASPASQVLIRKAPT
jgi:hypothetical protein